MVCAVCSKPPGTDLYFVGEKICKQATITAYSLYGKKTCKKLSLYDCGAIKATSVYVVTSKLGNYLQISGFQSNRSV